MKNIAVLGTGSDVGKSIIAAAICRSLRDKGVNVAPFKSQNMSNNSGITPEGLEIGRAQIVQAEAAKIVPHVDMNPILLKPTNDKDSQVVLNGKIHTNNSAMAYHKDKSFYFNKACNAFKRLSSRHEIIVLEGAGSCAEVNLMPTDIVNFKMAEYAKADVILVADIHRGGVFGQIVGTLECLPQKYRKMVKGFIINRFRGDINLFHEGIQWIEKQTQKKVFGVLPWYSHFKIDAEDSVEIEHTLGINSMNDGIPAIGIIKLPRIANFTDFHPILQIKGLQTLFIDKAVDLNKFKAIIIPGSKNTNTDLDWLKKTGLAEQIIDFANNHGSVLGICGGYQMLGKYVNDPKGLEGEPGKTHGLGLLDHNTELKGTKTTTLSDFIWDNIKSSGYEIHMGHTQKISGRDFITINSRNNKKCSVKDGLMSGNGNVIGTYIHGLFDSNEIVNKWFNMIGLDTIILTGDSFSTKKEKNYNLLKEHFEKHINFDYV